jgi:peroxiredoxin
MRGLLSVLCTVALLAAIPLRAAALEAGEKAPAIAAKDLSGKPVGRAQLAGKVVLVDFWATWCAPCKIELPVLNGLQKKYGARGLVIVAVSVDKDMDNARKFAKKLGLAMPVVHDAKHALAEKFEPPKMPSSYLIDRKGKVRKVYAGYHKGDEVGLEKEIVKLLGG